VEKLLLILVISQHNRGNDFQKNRSKSSRKGVNASFSAAFSGNKRVSIWKRLVVCEAADKNELLFLKRKSIYVIF
jgi:hypothetical protein